MKRILMFLRDTEMPYTKYKAGDTIEYKSWSGNVYRGETIEQLEKKGQYVFCFGHGCFDLLTEGSDVSAKEPEA